MLPGRRGTEPAARYTRGGKAMKKVLIAFCLSIPLFAFLGTPAFSETKVEATIFSFDGSDFVRSETTLIADGKSASATKLDRNSDAYKALIKKQSFVGPATLFGHSYEANYAPLTGKDGNLIGALFVGIPKN